MTQDRNNQSTFSPTTAHDVAVAPQGYAMSMREQLEQKFGIRLPPEEYDQEIQLPSRGVVYPTSSPFHNRTSVKIRRMRAKDEDILINSQFWRDGTLFTELIRSCLVDPVGADPRELLVGDRAAIVNAIRITGYGSTIRIEDSQCTNPSCGHVEDIDADLGDFECRYLELQPEGPPSAPNEFTLQLTNFPITLRFSNGYDEEESLRQEMDKIAPKGGGAKAGKAVGQRNLPAKAPSNPMNKLILSANGVAGHVNGVPTALFNNLLDMLTPQDRKIIRRFYNENTPGLLLKHEHVCSKCSTPREVEVPLAASLFRAVND